MSVFDIDTRGAATVLGDAPAVRLDQVEPTFGYRTAYGFGAGIMRGGARLVQAAGVAGGVVPMAFDRIRGTGTQAADAYFAAVDQVASNAVDYWTPRAEEVGTAGRLLGGLAEMVLPLAAGVGNPAALLVTQGLGTGADLVRQGVPGEAAAAVGTVQAAATAGGFAIPFLGKTLATRIGLGAAGNLATNVPADAASQTILQAARADEAAKRFDPLNLEARVLDVVSGGLFGAAGHLVARAEAADAARSVANAEHFQQGTAPRAPATFDEASVHQRAVEAAIDQMARGERVTVPAEVAAAFDGAEMRASLDMLAAMREVMPAEDLAPDARPAPVADLQPTPRAPEPATGEPQRARAAEDAGQPQATRLPEPPELQAARQTVDLMPELRVRLDDGTEVRASELLSLVQQDLQRADSDSRAFEAAVNCFLRG